MSWDVCNDLISSDEFEWSFSIWLSSKDINEDVDSSSDNANNDIQNDLQSK